MNKEPNLIIEYFDEEYNAHALTLNLLTKNKLF